MQKIILAFLFFLLNLSINAQCVEPAAFITYAGGAARYSTAGATAQVGSSFQACMTGELTKIVIRFDTINDGNLNSKLIFRDVLLPGLVGTVGATNEYEQDIVITPGVGFQEFILTTPYPVVGGTSYAWFIQRGMGPAIYIEGDAFGNLYPEGGSMNGLSGSPNANVDLLFQVSISPAFQIPTLSQWGIIMLSLVTMIFGLLTIKQRKLAID